MTNMMLFGGNSNPQLVQNVSQHLNLPIGKAKVSCFSDGEIMVEILENVRGREIFLLQSTSAPCNDYLMELVIMADALRRASAQKITAVIPYFGYARQDRRIRSSRVPISAKLVADMITAAGVNRVITVDLHAEQIQGFFYIPVDNIYASPVILEDIFTKKYPAPLVVSPDVGGVMRARAIAKRITDSDLAIIDKRRPTANQSEVMNIIGDVANRNCIIIDDIVDTAGTLCQAAKALKEHGATTVTAYATHAILSGNALTNITQSALDEVIVTNSIALSEEAKKCPKIRVLNLCKLIAETIYRVNHKGSVSSIFN